MKRLLLFMAILLSIGAWAQPKIMSLRIDDMHCKKCSDRITAKLIEVNAIDSIRVSLDKHRVLMRYEESMISGDSIRAIITQLGYTPVSYCQCGKGSYAYFLIPAEQSTQETLDKVKAIKGVKDANTNARRKSLAVKYHSEELSADQLLENLHKAGIQAVLPKPHECKEEK